MAKEGFGRCNTVTRKWEGGYANHPSDPGGKTMNGITEAKFHEVLRKWGLPLRAVRTITADEVDRIYREEYWNPAGCENLFPGVDLSVYDASVNSGVSRGKKWLAASVGSNDHSVTVKKICAVRTGFVKGLGTFKVFGKGWMNRITNIEATGVKWALQAMGLQPVEVKERLNNEADAAESTAANQTVSGGVAGAGSGTAIGTGTTVIQSPFEQIVVIGLGGVLLIGVAFLAYHAYKNFVRAKAFREA